MTKKRAHLFAAIMLWFAGITFLHARQIWPVDYVDLVGIYREQKNSKDVIHLKANGEFERQLRGRKVKGKWTMSRWDGDVTFISVRINGANEDAIDSYLVGSSFGQVENLYVSNKMPMQWRKVAH